ncbi:MAG TPA: hypothetical protein VGD45_00735 [Steroidobacter sp.]|uniref:hypothetical protein n=1 Tax=Steroidobacter sp. TaxID=1978227 RepID=UPI002EDB5A22
MTAMTDVLNRSLRALEDAGAIDARKLRTAYYPGSRYYELVTEQMVYVANNALQNFDAVCEARKKD